MPHDFNLDQLAIRLKAKMELRDLSVRAAATEMGLGAATLGRLLKGAESATTPDLANVSKAADWVGTSLSELSYNGRQHASTIADVEVHLRALPGLEDQDVEALVAMVKAGYNHAKKVRSTK
jgi:transcriptional regulator with XRE-family HTH domain